jgi:hypothetical protein
VCTAEACRPIYERKTARNEYEIIIFESVDESQSHLHPVLRVKEVRFELDKDMAPAEALLDIAEARQACKGDWDLHAEPMFMDISATCPGSGVQFKMFTHDMKAPADAGTPISRISMVLAE